MSVRELHNSLISDTNDGGLKDARDENGKIVISDSTLRSLLPPQLKQMSERYKVICGFECCISDSRAIKVVNSLWNNKTKRKVHSKINDKTKRNLYIWITRHPQVFQSPIYNDCIKVIFDDHTELQLVPKLLPQVSVRELYNILSGDPNYGGIRDARYEKYNII